MLLCEQRREAHSLARSRYEKAAYAASLQLFPRCCCIFANLIRKIWVDQQTNINVFELKDKGVGFSKKFPHLPFSFYAVTMPFSLGISIFSCPSLHLYFVPSQNCSIFSSPSPLNCTWLDSCLYLRESYALFANFSSVLPSARRIWRKRLKMASSKMEED